MLVTLRKWINLSISIVRMKRSLKREQRAGIALFDTSANTDNLGDYIIMRFCRKALEPLLLKECKVALVPTHTVPTENDLKQLNASNSKIVCGTNLLYPELEHASIWKFPNTFENYRNCILMGVGWGYYSKKTSLYSKLLYRIILDKTKLHAVRDLYTWNKLKEAGIKNVIYTGCPTMWGLTKEFCSKIPEKKGKDVVVTVTSYTPNKELDTYMLDVLCNNYRYVYIWPQGKDDREYILSFIPQRHNLCILDRSLEAFDKILELSSIDYIGTRLHGGVQAINSGKRSLIIAVDNRAKEIGKDTKLPVLNREDIKQKLESKILSKYKTEIIMPFENIEIWKQQFM